MQRREVPPRRPRLFYGWYILGVAMLGALLSSGSSQVVFSIMLKPITDEFGWGRTALASIVTLGTVGNGVLTPLVGHLSDRYGPRAVMTCGLLVTGVSYVLMPVLTQFWQFAVVFGTGRAVAGGAVIGVAPNTALANWFRRKRGRAMGLLAMSIPLGNGLLVLVGQYLIDTSGWRTVFVVLAVGTLALVVPVVLIVRHRPEDMGLLPDGEVADRPAGGARHPAPAAPEPSWTLRQATRCPSLWLIAVAGFLATMANAGVTFHQVAYFTDLGIPPIDAVISLAVFSLTGALAAVLWGYLTERVPERRLLLVTYLLGAGIVVYLLTVRTLAGALVFAVLFGFTSRGGNTLLNLILAEYFGRASFGTISGFVQPFSMAGLAVGPLVASIVFDLTGTYFGVFLGYAGLWTAGAGCLWLARQPTAPPAPPAVAGRPAPR